MIVAVVLESHELLTYENVRIFKFDDNESFVVLEIDKKITRITKVVKTVCFSDNGTELSRTSKQ